ncbi:hypothetical protein Hamer_G011749 [Homarus americanus]|uniref:Uncharacterized protein n=1 Tax=Homarus americanus TaxID=6706 RepID=A0A8J5KAD8_HOMAM|nr:hypothetical protein Hamer_G011749 [Homarus americanus]
MVVKFARSPNTGGPASSSSSRKDFLPSPYSLENGEATSFVPRQKSFLEMYYQLDVERYRSERRRDSSSGCVITEELISAHLITEELISAHLITEELISAHLITEELISAHLITEELISAHLITEELISAHLITEELISAHLITVIENMVLDQPNVVFNFSWIALSILYGVVSWTVTGETECLFDCQSLYNYPRAIDKIRVGFLLSLVVIVGPSYLTYIRPPTVSSGLPQPTGDQVFQHLRPSLARSGKSNILRLVCAFCLAQPRL